MVAKIMGANYDDLAKLMGADLIVLGTAVVGEVKTGSTFYAGSTTLLTGSGTQTLNPANENVPAGYYAATTLSAVDGDLAAANILSGVTIFGFTGPATVQEIGTSNALVGEVMNGRTFFSVTGGEKTGNLATVAIVAANENYPQGYHVGNVGGLSAIDADLAVGNIALGVTIFGFLGTYDPSVSPTFEQYYAANLAAGGATYTVATTGLFQGSGEVMGASDIMTQQGFSTTWGDGNKTCAILMSSGSDVRIKNYDPGNAYDAALARCALQHSSPTYELYSSGNTTENVWYTVAADGLYSINLFQADEDDMNFTYGESEWFNGSDWLDIQQTLSLEGMTNLHIGVDGKLRYRDTQGDNKRSVMRWF